MKTLLGTLICTALLSANIATATPKNPATPRSFETNAFVTNQNKIWVAVEKSSPTQVTVLLSKDGDVFFKRFIGKNESKFAAKLDVSDLASGQYQLEFISSEGSVKKIITVGAPVLVEPTRMISMK